MHWNFTEGVWMTPEQQYKMLQYINSERQHHFVFGLVVGISTACLIFFFKGL